MNDTVGNRKNLTPESVLALTLSNIVDGEGADAEKLARIRQELAPRTREQVGQSFESVYDIVAAGAGTGTRWVDTADGTLGELLEQTDETLKIAGESGRSDVYGPYVVTAWYDKQNQPRLRS